VPAISRIASSESFFTPLSAIDQDTIFGKSLMHLHCFIMDL
jgi:hypothetical protein